MLELNRTAIAYGWLFINPGKELEKYPRNSVTNFWPYDEHPNKLGHEILGKSIFQELVKNSRV